VKKAVVTMGTVAEKGGMIVKKQLQTWLQLILTLALDGQVRPQQLPHQLQPKNPGREVQLISPPRLINSQDLKISESWSQLSGTVLARLKNYLWSTDLSNGSVNQTDQGAAYAECFARELKSLSVVRLLAISPTIRCENFSIRSQMSPKPKLRRYDPVWRATPWGPQELLILTLLILTGAGLELVSNAQLMSVHYVKPTKILFHGEMIL